MIRIILFSVLFFLLFRWIFRIFRAFTIGSQAMKDSRFKVYRVDPSGMQGGSSSNTYPKEKDVTDRGRVIED
jgi:hypothetical protein